MLAHAIIKYINQSKQHALKKEFFAFYLGRGREVLGGVRDSLNEMVLQLDPGDR